MRPLNKWEKNYCNSDDAGLIKSSFKKRHKFCVSFFVGSFVLNFAIPVLAIYVFGYPKQAYENSVVFVCLTLSFVLSIFYFLFRFRCPRCNAVPASCEPGTSGILLFPKKCGKCGAPLLPDHPWAQD